MSLEYPGQSVYDQMARIVNPRYAGCRLDNYEVGSDQYAKRRSRALEKAEMYAKALRASPRSGQNLIMFGRCGTGKDHLAVGVIRTTLGRGMAVKYIRGSVLCSVCREHNLEHATDVPHDYMNADLLVISDIEPNEGKISEFEARALMTLIDHRYCHLLPTIITSNLMSMAVLSELVGERIVDRICEGAIIIPMIWDSYRKDGAS